jgi:hypothetical protein
MASPRQVTNPKAVIPVQRDAQRKNCHPKIEQLKICQLKIHTLEVFAVFILSIASLSEEYGELGYHAFRNQWNRLRRIRDCFLDECNVSHVLAEPDRETNKKTM